MTIVEAFILGVFQGITEFLPISSSGHLVVIQEFLKINTPGVTFEVLLHFGSLVSVIIFFRKDIFHLITHPTDRFFWLIVVGIIPTGIIGVLFEDLFERLFGSITVVAIMLLVTGLILWIAETLASGKKDSETMTIKDALIIGFAQGLAITPGLSRSGSTIAAALIVGLDRDTAARYSFLVVIPVIFGATMLKVGDMFSTTSVDFFPIQYLVGTITAGITGYFAIAVLLKVLNTGRLKLFSIYCWTVGGLILLTNLF
ncbi:undecaprenyl-diphosphatase UppP [Metallumcola ferriviriculae]|uniref:Undecaprenyl-diphosphatase n=1 Tax=Metallumcola ferriviriculae TaxID=3039180 RepID=A0AAU0UMH5_9FIRM|nr:undecaprenyl-diphosphatase UppP [Desulfitibacteraceae bacterium MK1]